MAEEPGSSQTMDFSKLTSKINKKIIADAFEVYEKQKIDSTIKVYYFGKFESAPFDTKMMMEYDDKTASQYQRDQFHGQFADVFKEDSLNSVFDLMDVI
jgi:hypothetical protein